MTNWSITKPVRTLKQEHLNPEQKILLLGDPHLHTVSMRLKWRPQASFLAKSVGPGKTVESIFSRANAKELILFPGYREEVRISAEKIRHFSAIGLQLGNNTHRLYFPASQGNAHFNAGQQREGSVQYIESSLVKHCCRKQIQGLLQLVDDIRSLSDAPIFHIPGPPPKNVYSEEDSEIVMSMHQRRLDLLHKELKKRGVFIIELPSQASDEEGYLLAELDTQQGSYRGGKDRAHAGPKFGRLILNSIQEFLKREGIGTA